ncbi:putative cytochrome P450 [Septoria linicola]|nr:putative cytochrome P450 [Septoria linicola]
MAISASTVLLVVLCFGITVYLWSFLKKPSRRLPPGPKGWPLVGNLNDLPQPDQLEYEVWSKHKGLYGPLSSLTVLGQTIIIINSADMAIELFEKRAALHSSRPAMTFAGTMCGWDLLMVFQGRPERLRQYRKQFHAIIGTSTALSKFVPLQEVEVSRFLLRVLEQPDQLLQHVRTEAGAIILKLAYGYDIEPHKEDPLVKLAEEALEQFSLASVAGAWIVDFVPALRHLPDWVPGTAFKRTARAWRRTLLNLGEIPMRFAKQQIQLGQHEPSFISGLYEQSGGGLSAEEEDVAKWSATSMYSGGSDTSVSSMQLFFLAMSVYPGIQRQAQAEIDSIIGSDRLPTLADRRRLPYVSALVSEVLRWHVVAPMGVPHVATADDSIAGYDIPKGSVLLPNIWWFTHDPATYAEPMDFRPERFLGDSPERDPRDYVFGFGRRACPGKVLADTSIWITVAKSLAALNIEKAVGEEGRVIEPEIKFTAGIISHPVPFKAKITARSAKHEALVRSIEVTNPWVEGTSELLVGLDK